MQSFCRIFGTVVISSSETFFNKYITYILHPKTKSTILIQFHTNTADQLLKDKFDISFPSFLGLNSLKIAWTKIWLNVLWNVKKELKIAGQSRQWGERIKISAGNFYPEFNPYSQSPWCFQKTKIQIQFIFFHELNPFLKSPQVVS